MIRFEPQHFAEIKTFISDFSGILLDRAPHKGVYDRIRKHIETVGVAKVSEYLDLLKNPGSLGIRDELIALVTVNESSFFRNPAQFRYLADTLFPRFYEQKLQAGLKQVNIWSAGCSTGEETYSIAFMAEWFQKQHPRLNFNIIGTDLNTACLEKAREGKFRKRSVRKAYHTIATEYASELLLPRDDETFEVPSEIREKVQFRFLNLHEKSSLGQMRRTDIIFCRNVLIYFDDSFRKTLIDCFFELLNPEGYLFLGETESLPAGMDRFELVNCSGGFCYRKVACHETQR